MGQAEAGELLPPRLAVPFFVSVRRDLSLDQQLGELSTLGFALEWHVSNLGCKAIRSPTAEAPGRQAVCTLPCVTIDDFDTWRLNTLTRLLREWTAEYEKIALNDEERARHLSDAIADLNTLIERLKNHHS